MFHADRVIIRLPCGQGPEFQNLENTMWLAKRGKGMLSSVEQVFVGRDEKRAPLKRPVWEATTTATETLEIQQFLYELKSNLAVYRQFVWGIQQ